MPRPRPTLDDFGQWGAEVGFLHRTDPARVTEHLDHARKTWPDDAAHSIHVISGLIEDLERARWAAVRRARRQGSSWARIGRAAGIAKQSAWERWGRRRQGWPTRKRFLMDRQAENPDL